MNRMTTYFLRPLALIFCLTTSFTLSAQCITNLAANPGFEDDGNGDGRPDSWYTFGGGTFILQTTTTPDGTGFAGEGQDPNGNNNLYVAQGVNGIVAGDDYTFSADIRVDLSGGGYCNIGMNFRGANGDNSPYYKESVASTGTDFVNYTISRTAVTAATSNNNTDATSVQIFVEVGGGATVIVDNADLQAPPATPTMDCPGSIIANGTVNDGIAEYNSYGTAITFSPQGGIGCDGAIEITCAGNCGTGRYGITTAPNNAFELRFQGRVVNSGGNENGEIVFFDDAFAPYDSEKVQLQGSEYVEYRLVAEGVDPNITSAAIQFNGTDGSSFLIDEICVLPFVESPVVDIPDNFLANGDFEEGNAITSGGGFQVVNDPSTGMKGLVLNNSGYGAGRTDKLPVTAGESYDVMVDTRRVGDLQYAKVNVTWYDASNAQIGNRLDNNLPVSADYISSTFTYTAPAGAAFIDVQIEASGGNGYFALDNLAIVGQSVLPVELSDFSAAARSKDNLLSWETASEENTAMFYVERSGDGNGEWAEIAAVSALGGGGLGASYAIADEDPLPTGYYRLRSVDFDGYQQLSDVRMVARAAGATLRAYPNPLRDELTVRTNLAEAGVYRLTDLLGREVATGIVAAGPQVTVLSTARFRSGQYLLTVGSETIRLVK